MNKIPDIFLISKMFDKEFKGIFDMKTQSF